MATATTSRLVQLLLRGPLLSGDRREELLRLEGRFPDPHGLARELVRLGWLTAFQVNQIARGKADELALGPYVLLERLGEGGMGQVFKARHRTLHRLCALKILRKEYLGNPRAVRRFQREIRAVGQLAHPHVVHAFDADQVDGTYYIALEYVDGLDLDRLVKRVGPLPADLACALMRQAALGLQHIHEQGLVHRDVKPGNLLVEGVGAEGGVGSGESGVGAEKSHSLLPHLKVLDLGLARWTDPDAVQSLLNLTQLGTVMGTPEFIAPEQARDSSTCDIRADLYSLGCTFFFLLAGQAPFPDGSVAEKLMAHQLREPPAINEARRGRTSADEVPALVEEVVRCLMEKRPEDRFQTPVELAGVLAQLAPPPAEETTVPLEEAVADTRPLVVVPERPQRGSWWRWW